MSPIVIPNFPATSTTLLDIRTDMQARGYETDNTAAQNSCINTAYRRLCGEHHWTWLEASVSIPIVAGDSAFSLAAVAPDLIHARNLLVAPPGAPFQPYIIPDYVTATDYLKWANVVSPGPPQEWSIESGLLLIGPVADQAYTAALFYIFDPEDLAADADELAVPNTYRDAVTFGALAEVSSRQRDWAQHDRWMQKYQEMVLRMKAQLGLQQQQTTTQVTRSGFFSDRVAWPYGV